MRTIYLFVYFFFITFREKVEKRKNVLHKCHDLLLYRRWKKRYNASKQSA